MNYRSQSLSQFTHYPLARRVLLALGLSPFLLIGAQLTRLGSVEHERYSAMALDNLETEVRLSAPRGNIRDREGRVVATNQRTWTVTYSAWRQSDENIQRVFGELSDLLGPTLRMTPEDVVAEGRRTRRHVLARRQEQSTVLPLIENPSLFPGVRLQEDFRREYLYPTELALVVGHVGRIPEGRTDAYAPPRYRPDDEVGRAGLEAGWEHQLAGQPGRERLQRDARGRLLNDPELLIESTAGYDLTLTIDAEVQSFAYRRLGRETGSVVVMDVRTGDVLVMASTPSYDSNRPGATTVDGRDAGFVNRAARGLYPPASTFKIVGVAAALRAGVGVRETVNCRGSVTIDGWRRPFWCNVRTGHGPLDASGALKVSCNAYFYQLASQIGAEAMRAEALRWGFGERTGFELAEAAGNVPSAAQLTPGELTNFSIGQGQLLATPLQVVRATAGLANGSMLPVPRIVAAVDGAPRKPEPGKPLDLPTPIRQAIVSGMDRAVNEQGGTIFRSQIPRSWEVVGKSGTAENARGGVDAWFTGFFPRTEPRWAFVVHIEGADGHGGEVAGPIARDVIRTVLEAEGRIPKTTPPSTQVAQSIPDPAQRRTLAPIPERSLFAASAYYDQGDASIDAQEVEADH